MSFTSYNNILSTIGEVVCQTAWDEMKKAGDEERKMAIESGCVDEDGIPMCAVVADGQWSKRSYKTKYNAMSGTVILSIMFVSNKCKLLIFLFTGNDYWLSE